MKGSAISKRRFRRLALVGLAAAALIVPQAAQAGDPVTVTVNGVPITHMPGLSPRDLNGSIVTHVERTTAASRPGPRSTAPAPTASAVDYGDVGIGAAVAGGGALLLAAAAFAVGRRLGASQS